MTTTELTIAKRAVKRLLAEYPSDLDLRPVYFNAKVQEQRSHVSTYGAARTAFERFLDRQTYWNWSWLNERTQGDTKRVPFINPIYPASRFQGRKKVEN